MALPMGGRKPKKIIWRSGEGDSSTLNTNPWQSKDIQYRYTVEASSPSRGCDYSDAEVAAGIDAALATLRRNAGVKHLNRLRSIEGRLNNLAEQSLMYEPMVRALARYGFAIRTEQQAAFVRYDINPILQYERLLLECCKLWEVATNKPVFEFSFGNAPEIGVGLKHHNHNLIEVQKNSIFVNTNSYWTEFQQKLHVQCALEDLISALSSQVWVKLSPQDKEVFAVSFINNIHRLSSSAVTAGVFKNVIEDELIANDEKLRSVGALLHNCYTFGQRKGLAISEPLPSYDLYTAEVELLERHQQVTMPHLMSYVARRLTSNFTPNEAFACFSEIVEHLADARVAENPSQTVQSLLEHSVIVVNKLERIALLMTAFFEAIKETTLERDKLVTLLFAVRELKANYQPIAGSSLASDVKLVLGAGYYEIAEELSFIQDL